MPIEIDVDEAKERIVLRARGNASDTDAREAVARLRELARRHEGFDFFGDASDVDGWSLSTAVIRSIAADAPVFGPDSRRAYVLPSLVAYGLGRMFTAFREGDPRRVCLFRTRADALEWLESEAHVERGVSPASSE
jgi:hypothetical protein